MDSLQFRVEYMVFFADGHVWEEYADAANESEVENWVREKITDTRNESAAIGHSFTEIIRLTDYTNQTSRLV